MPGLFEAVNHHVTAVAMRTNALKAHVIPAEQRQVILLANDPLHEGNKSKFFSSCIEEIRCRINQVHSVFSGMQSSLAA